MTVSNDLLSMGDVSFAYNNGRMILENVNFRLSRGEIVGITGSSGCGKTTLVYCLCGVIPHIYKGSISGDIRIMGEDTSALRLPQISQMLGVVFQNPDTQLFSTAVEDDVVFGPENLCLDYNEMDARLNRSLEAANVTGLRYRPPKTLSGGQAQLCALAAVLSLEPRILIFDEAASRLDKGGAQMLMDRVLSLKEDGCGIVMVEHDAERLAIADRVLTLREGILSE